MSRFRAVFLDRDGTLNTEIEYLHRVEDFHWIQGAVDAIRRLNEAGLLVLVATNQAGVARGYFSESDVQRLHAHMQQELQRQGAHIDAFYYCPFHPEGSVPEYRRPSKCRKPDTGMLEQGIAEWRLDPELCILVGDKNIDIEAGQRMGMRTILVETGYGRTEKASSTAHHTAPDLSSAVDLILEAADD